MVGGYPRDRVCEVTPPTFKIPPRLGVGPVGVGDGFTVAVAAGEDTAGAEVVVAGVDWLQATRRDAATMNKIILRHIENFNNLLALIEKLPPC
jgi:hypothetical protein